MRNNRMIRILDAGVLMNIWQYIVLKHRQLKLIKIRLSSWPSNLWWHRLLCNGIYLVCRSKYLWTLFPLEFCYSLSGWVYSLLLFNSYFLLRISDTLLWFCIGWARASIRMRFTDARWFFLKMRVGLGSDRFWWRICKTDFFILCRTLDAFGTGNRNSLRLLQSILKLLNAILGVIDYINKIIKKCIFTEHEIVVANKLFLQILFSTLDTLPVQFNLNPLRKLRKHLSNLKYLPPQKGILIWECLLLLLILIHHKCKFLFLHALWIGLSVPLGDVLFPLFTLGHSLYLLNQLESVLYYVFVLMIGALIVLSCQRRFGHNTSFHLVFDFKNVSLFLFDLMKQMIIFTLKHHYHFLVIILFFLRLSFN